MLVLDKYCLQQIVYYITNYINAFAFSYYVWLFQEVNCHLFNSCRSSVDFSIKVAWLLGAYSSDVRKPNWRNSQGIKLKNMILNDELRWVSLLLKLNLDILFNFIYYAVNDAVCLKYIFQYLTILLFVLD